MRRKRIREKVTERDGVSMKNERRKPRRRRTKGIDEIDDDCGRNEDMEGRKEEMQRRKRRRRGRI